MADQPITPTRIIPPGAPLPIPVQPAAPPAPPPPPRPPAPPRWAPPPPPPPGPVEVHVTVDLVYPQPEPEPVRDWSWLWRWARPAQTLGAVVLALVPITPGGSLVAVWSATLAECRTEASIGGAYALAAVALGAALIIDGRTGRWWARTLLVTAMIGGTGAMALYDPITWLTGVRP
ncbi:hypothetical protein [Streptomyces sp. NPDC050504]|uniref:hypothetical protein n=1 Tax=Streptomyces sp. NPDC050504 TaxID=3365618 RepID=UPI00379BE7D0